MNRPYFKHSSRQLQEEFEKHKADLSIVRALRAELDHRRTQWALQLREKIDAYLKALPAAVPPPAVPRSAPLTATQNARSVIGGSMKFFGIDLGTSTCSVSYAVNNPRPNFIQRPTEVSFRWGDPLRGNKSSVVPSVVARSGSGGSGQGATLFAFEAEETLEFNQVQGRNCQEVFRSVKSHLGTGRSYVRADPSLNTPVKVWAGLIRRLCEMTVAEKGKEFDPRQHQTVLTVPASFRKTQRDDTVEAARLAGFNVAKEADLVHLIDEPVAALIDILNHPDIGLHAKPEGENTVLVFDFGGGTCDLVVLKFRYDAKEPSGIAVRPQAISPYQQMGGDTIDLAIMDQVVWPQVCQQNGIKRDRLTATERKEIEDKLRYSVCRRLKEMVNEMVKEDRAQRPPEQFRRQDWAGIRSLPLPLAGHGIENLHGNVELSAEELYQVMCPFLEPDPSSSPFMVGESCPCVPFAKLIEITMERAGLTPDTLDLLVLHGGSCKSPFIPWGFERMKETGVLARNCKIIETPDLSTSVSLGAALFASLSKKYGKPYIRPIVPEDMSILTEGNRFESLVTAGTQLPYTKTCEKEFLLSSAGQREIVVPIYIGHEADSGLLAETLTIEIPQQLPQSHPVEVELKIGTDKDSLWRFRPKGGDWTPARLVANCWIGREPSEEVKKLLETRSTIRASLDNGQRPPARTLADEALQAARAGFPEEGLALIEDCLHANPKDHLAWNIKAMIYGQRREYEQSLKSYETASFLEPNDMVLRGNYGTALVRNKRHQEAVAVMREALSRDPSLTYLHWWLAEAFQALQNTEEMNKELEMWHAHARRESIRRPDDVATWEELRGASLRIGRYEDAEEASETIRGLRRLRNLLAGAKHG